MKNWSWTLILVSLAVLLGGCAAPGGQPQQAARTQLATAQEREHTPASAATVDEPAPTETTAPSDEEPTAPATQPPTAEEPTPTSLPTATVAPTAAQPAAAPSPAPAAALTSKDVQRLTAEQARALLDTEQAVLYDARSVAEYRTAHATGALSLPATDLPARLGELPAEKTLVFY